MCVQRIVLRKCYCVTHINTQAVRCTCTISLNTYSIKYVGICTMYFVLPRSFHKKIMFRVIWGTLTKLVFLKQYFVMVGLERFYWNCYFLSNITISLRNYLQIVPYFLLYPIVYSVESQHLTLLHELEKIIYLINIELCDALSLFV